MTGGFANSLRFTGRDFSGGRASDDFPALGLADEADGGMVSDVGAGSGLGVCEALLGNSSSSVAEFAGVDDGDWARDTGEKTKIKAAASTRDFISLKSLVTSSPN